MFQKCIAHDVNVSIFACEFAFIQNEIAILITLIKVLIWLELKNLAGHLETHGLDERSYLSAFFLGEAEGFIGFTIEATGDGYMPLVVELGEHLRRNGKLRSSSVNDCWVALISSLENFSIVMDFLTFESPCTQEVRIAWERLESSSAAHNLCRVNSPKEGIWWIILIK